MDVIITFTDPTIFEAEDTAFKGTATPYQTNGTDYMCLVRVQSEEDIPEGCNILGTYDEVFADADKKAVYDSIYVREYSYTDEEGNTITGVKPEKFGVFA